MRLSRFHIDQALSAGADLVVTGDTAHYLGNVLRLKAGMDCIVFNARDGEFAARISSVGKQQLGLTLGTALPRVGNSALRVHLGLGLSRGERMDYAVQKAVELGVAAITPLHTEFSEVKLQGERIANRQQHWQRIAINACEQCGRTDVPEVHLPAALTDWLATHRDGLVCDQDGTPGLETRISESSINLLVGPEGGLSSGELQQAVEQGYRKLRLGPRILRTETAPMVALSVLQYLYGDLGN